MTIYKLLIPAEMSSLPSLLVIRDTLTQPPTMAAGVALIPHHEFYHERMSQKVRK